MDDLLKMLQMATECVKAGRADEALLHLGMLESRLVATNAAAPALESCRRTAKMALTIFDADPRLSSDMARREIHASLRVIADAAQ